MGTSMRSTTLLKKRLSFYCLSTSSVYLWCFDTSDHEVRMTTICFAVLQRSGENQYECWNKWSTSSPHTGLVSGIRDVTWERLNSRWSSWSGGMVSAVNIPAHFSVYLICIGTLQSDVSLHSNSKAFATNWACYNATDCRNPGSIWGAATLDVRIIWIHASEHHQTLAKRYRASQMMRSSILDFSDENVLPEPRILHIKLLCLCP